MNKLIRMVVGNPYLNVPGNPQVVSLDKDTADRYLASNQAVPVCGVGEEVQLASYVAAAAALGLAVVPSGDHAHEIREAAQVYGAKIRDPARSK